MGRKWNAGGVGRVSHHPSEDNGEWGAPLPIPDPCSKPEMWQAVGCTLQTAFMTWLWAKAASRPPRAPSSEEEHLLGLHASPSQPAVLPTVDKSIYFSVGKQNKRRPCSGTGWVPIPPAFRRAQDVPGEAGCALAERPPGPWSRITPPHPHLPSTQQSKVQSPEIWIRDAISLLLSVGGEIEAQRQRVTCLTSHSKLVP